MAYREKRASGMGFCLICGDWHVTCDEWADLSP
jgi:hypothetical protein